MNVEMAREEYRALLDLLQIAHWVLHARQEDNAESESYEALIQKFYALAEAMGLEQLIRYDPDERTYSPTKTFEETSPAWDFMDDFIDHAFWDELIHRMTDRDLSRRVGGYDKLDSMSMSDRFSLETPLMERYSEEFDEHGLERLEIVEHFGPGTKQTVKTSD